MGPFLPSVRGVLRVFVVAVFSVMASFSSTAAAASVRSDYLYDLSSFTGKLHFQWPRIAIDRQLNEIYVLEGNSVRIFDTNGMETYEFNLEGGANVVSDIAVTPEGNILLLSSTPRRTEWDVDVRNYRGEPLTRIRPAKLPSDFASSFLPSDMVYREGRLYLADKISDKVVVLAENGAFLEGYDLAAIIGLEEKKRRDNAIEGFNVDREGNILFTIPTLFAAYRVSPDKKFVSFGKRGSAPGHFNIVAGVYADDEGHYFLLDSLRCVVMVFEKDFNFQMEFGYRGDMPGNLIVPKQLALDGRGRLYVTQGSRRGVSVFQVKFQ